MTERQIDNRVKKLKELEAQQKALEQEAEAIKTELKAVLEEQNTEELKTGNFTIRWKMIFSNKFDSKLFKAELPEMYEKYCNKSGSKRFTIA